MLLQLEISNIALIDRVSVEMGEGLNILTGETGAGKSVIIDSINAILGARLSKEMIRTGAEKALVEAVFQVDNERFADLLESMGIEPEEDGALIVSREFTLSGKNTCRVNGKMVTVSMLKAIGERLIDIHGQFDNQSLLKTENHIELLDSFGGEKIQALKQEYSSLLMEYRRVKSKIAEISGDRGERERKADLLKFQIDEIKKARLKVGEEEELNRQRLKLANSEKIVSALSTAYDLLFSGTSIKSSASDNINSALLELSDIARLDKKYDDIAKKLEDLSYQLEDVIYDIREERDRVEYDPALLEQIEERLDLISRLRRKYGSTIEEVLEYGKKIQRDLEEITRSEGVVNELRKRLEELDDRLYKLAKSINKERLAAIKVLEEKICNELSDLEMKRAKFKVNIEFDDLPDSNGERRYTQNGLDRVEFLISTNEGEPLKPLSKIASGGEMARIMLAIKTILADVDKMPTLIIDEIDIGVSGKVAQKVGEKLSYVSKRHQVICVTHLAQIACMADNHYLIEKMPDGTGTRTRVKKLDDKEAQAEIARMMGGAVITEITKKHAEEMLRSAREFKSSMV